MDKITGSNEEKEKFAKSPKGNQYNNKDWAERIWESEKHWIWLVLAAFPPVIFSLVFSSCEYLAH